jgi:hypothetical protein
MFTWVRVAKPDVVETVDEQHHGHERADDEHGLPEQPVGDRAALV